MFFCPLRPGNPGPGSKNRHTHTFASINFALRIKKKELAKMGKGKRLVYNLNFREIVAFSNLFRGQFMFSLRKRVFRKSPYQPTGFPIKDARLLVYEKSIFSIILLSFSSLSRSGKFISFKKRASFLRNPVFRKQN